MTTVLTMLAFGAAGCSAIFLLPLYELRWPSAVGLGVLCGALIPLAVALAMGLLMGFRL